MITVLEYLVIAAAIGAVMFFLAVFVFGRGEQMAPLDPRTSPAQLPENGVTAADVRSVKFSLAVRGYRMSDVDWTLERVSDELDELRKQNSELRVAAGYASTEASTPPFGSPAVCSGSGRPDATRNPDEPPRSAALQVGPPLDPSPTEPGMNQP